MFTGIVTVKLDKPQIREDRKIEEVVLDFGKVNGVVIKECEKRDFMDGDMGFMVRGWSASYCSVMASLISGIGQRDIDTLPFNDFEKVWQTVGAFVQGRNPQEFYDQFSKDEGGEGEGLGFTAPPAPVEKKK
jgi:hypothetical protein